MATRRYVLLFDRDCGICSAMGRWIRILDLRRRIWVRPIQSSTELLPGIPEGRVLEAFHMVSPAGQVTTGGDAIPILIEALPLGAGLGRIVRKSAALRPWVHAAYRFLTRLRDRLVCRLDFAATWEGSAH